MQQRTLLLVDDDRLWVKITAQYLRFCKYNVITAVNCAEAYKMIQTHRPDCVLLDFHLPDAKGCVLALQVRETAEVRKTPIIMVSGDGRKEFESCHKYMVDGFFLKGWPLERACAMIESLLRRVDWERGIVVHNDLRLDGTSLTIFRNSKPLAELSPDQFTFLSLLISKAPAFVAEDAVVRHVFGETCEIDKTDAIRMLVHRLRQRLGRQLARRIKNKKNRGWIYLGPRIRSLTPPVQPENG